MNGPNAPKTKPKSVIHKWIRRGFFAWAILSTLYLANSFRTQGVDPSTLQSDPLVTVVSTGEMLELQPPRHNDAGVIFLCGSGVAAEAYAPLLRPLAEQGYPVKIIRLPLRFAPFESNKVEAIRRALAAASDKQGPRHWVISGHSLGGALACRAVQDPRSPFAALVLLGTTHPKSDDLSRLAIAVTKVYGDKDGVATAAATLANKPLLPATTEWVLIEGGNHSQFGHYGWQVLDGWPGVTRQHQQEQARTALLQSIQRIGRRKGAG